MEGVHRLLAVSVPQKGNRENIQSLGLEPRNYVPHADRLDASSWEGALHRWAAPKRQGGAEGWARHSPAGPTQDPSVSLEDAASDLPSSKAIKF